MRQPKIIVVGGGLAGLMATIRVAEAGVPVQLFSIVPVKRSHSVCAQGGINAAKNKKGEGDSPAKHFDDTIYGGDFLANQPLVKRMCDEAPAIIDLLDAGRIAGLPEIWRDIVSPDGICGSDDRAAAFVRVGRASAAT
jgi:succinate dehydrogenase / fumarate reductase flavoprotein subunit